MGLQKKRYRKQTRRHARPTEIRALKLLESIVTEQFPPVSGQQSVEAVGPDKAQVLRIPREKAILI